MRVIYVKNYCAAVDRPTRVQMGVKTHTPSVNDTRSASAPTELTFHPGRTDSEEDNFRWWY